MNGDPLQAEVIVQSLRIPLAVVDDELRVQHHNTAFSRLFGLPADLPNGRPLVDLAPALAEHEAAIRRLAAGAVQPTADAGPDELEIGTGNGPGRTLRLAADPVPSPGWVVLTFHDVSDRRQLEREARRYRIELERSNRELQDFAHAASHDLQEPLRKIRTYASRLPDLLDLDETNEKARTYLSRMEEAGERLQARTEALLQLARIGRSRPVPEEVDLGETVREVLGDMAMAIEESGARIRVGDLPVLEADPVQMRILFQNLIANALKFHAEGTDPVVRIGLDHVEAAREGGPARYVLAVEDEGVGFAPEYGERIFEPFQRLHGRTEYPGSGIGLSLCRRVVEHHHGTVRAESPAGTGARFLITLPATQPEAMP